VTVGHIDELTGLLNRRGFLALAEVELRLFQRRGLGLVLAFVDVDGLKRLKDTAGHEAGDELLRVVARGMRAACREDDLVGRLGGDEFVALMSDFDASVERIIFRLRQAITASGFDALGKRPSVSIGVAQLDGESETLLDDLIAEADAAMYADKQARVVSP
jgi:diguanylate cyclase (GGDEF)-like protein